MVPPSFFIRCACFLSQLPHQGGGLLLVVDQEEVLVFGQAISPAVEQTHFHIELVAALSRHLDRDLRELRRTVGLHVADRLGDFVKYSPFVIQKADRHGTI